MSVITRKIEGLEDTANLSAAYRVIWRWHFYAGLLCLPFIVVLCLSGAVYLFKPQINTWLDRPYDHMALSGPVQSLDAQVAAAQRAMPEARIMGLELRPDRSDAARVSLMARSPDPASGRAPEFKQYRALVRPDTLEILKLEDENWRPVEIAGNIHGELLLGLPGHILLELVGCWAIVMTVTGLYLWWPRGTGLAGTLYPRLSAGGRLFWRDLHAVTGVWLSFLAMFFLLTALPWTYVWGEAFHYARSIGERALIHQEWSTGPAAKQEKRQEQFERAPLAQSEDPHAQHHIRSGGPPVVEAPALAGFDRVAPIAAGLGLPERVLLAPPSPDSPNWVLTVMTQNRTLERTVQLDPKSLQKLGESGFSSYPLIEKVFNVGIAAHEGQLFGWPNQLLGFLTVIGYLALVVSSTVMWWRRRPQGALGAPPAFAPEPKLASFVVGLIVCLGMFLPALGISLIVVLIAEQAVRRFAPRTAKWLGIRTT